MVVTFIPFILHSYFQCSSARTPLQTESKANPSSGVTPRDVTEVDVVVVGGRQQVWPLTQFFSVSFL